MKLEVKGFEDGGVIPDDFAMFRPHPEDHAQPAPNRNPEIRWRDLPEGTRSVALIVVDPDAPTDPTDVNQEGRSVPKDLPRADFHHCAIVDIDPSRDGFAEGELSDGVKVGGKETGRTGFGVVGKNDYTSWFEGDDQMEGVYGGYDGPGPPWNDERIHHYHFRVYALDVPTLDLEGDFGAPEAMEKMSGHILAEGEWVGTYTNNPELRSEGS